jgi:peptide/nickel transport system substrate-binding protein
MTTNNTNSEDKRQSGIPEWERLYRAGKLSRRDFMRVTALLGVGGLAVACAPGPAAQPPAAPAATQAPTAAPAPTAAAAATAVPAPAQAKVLRMAITQNQATSFDVASTGSGSVPIDTMMYEWLVRYKGGTADVEPWLAKSWEMSADNTTATFKLQEGVQWQKGYGEFTADDVKFTIDRMINEKLPEAENWKNLDHIEVVDKYTVKFVMKSPSPTLFSLSLPFQAGMIMCKKAVEELGAKAFNETPVGTGPYEIVSYDPQQGVRFKKYDKYWGTRALDVDEVLWAFPKDPLTALQAGDIDMVATAQMGTLADAAKVADAVSASRLTRYWWISLPVNNAILKDINARKAIRAALDIDPIVEASSLGMGVRGYAMVPPGIPGYWADAPQYKQDVAQAKQFMKDAGYPDGFTVPFLAMSSPPDPGVELIRQQLEAVGIKLDVTSVDGDTWWSLAPKGEHMLLISYQTLPDGGYTLQYFVTDQFWNTMKWSNKQFDDLNAKVAAEMDPKVRNEQLIQMQKLMDDDCAMAYVGYQPQGAVYRKGILNLGANDEALLVNGVLDSSRVRMGA